MPLAAAATIGAIAIGVLQLVGNRQDRRAREPTTAIVSDMPRRASPALPSIAPSRHRLPRANRARAASGGVTRRGSANCTGRRPPRRATRHRSSPAQGRSGRISARKRDAVPSAERASRNTHRRRAIGQRTRRPLRNRRRRAEPFPADAAQARSQRRRRGRAAALRDRGRAADWPRGKLSRSHPRPPRAEEATRDSAPRRRARSQQSAAPAAHGPRCAGCKAPSRAPASCRSNVAEASGRRARESRTPSSRCPTGSRCIRKLRDEGKIGRGGEGARGVPRRVPGSRSSCCRPICATGSRACALSPSRCRVSERTASGSAPAARRRARRRGVSHSSPGASARGGHERTATRCGCSRQPEVREAVLDRRQLVADVDAAPKRARQCATTSASTASSGRLHSPPQMPAAGRFSNRIVARALDHQHAHRALRQRLSRPRRRQLVDAPVAARDAIARDRAVVAARRASRAHRRAEIHHAPACRSRCRVAGSSDSASAHSCARDLRRARIALDAAMAREHALHVAVEDRARARRTRTRRSPPPSSGRCRAARRASSTSRGNSPPCSRDDRLRRACR